MQRKAPLTPQARKPNRVTSRATMAPTDFSTSVSGSSGNRLLPSRQSVMTNVQSFSDTARKLECENKDADMKQLYNAHLQTEMIALLMKKKAEEQEKIITSQLATLMKEEDAIKKELFSVKRKERDLENLIKLQNNLDEQLADIMARLADFDGKPVEILKHLRSILESLDVLKCENIIIPETREGMGRLHDQLKSCESILLSINEKIGTRRDALHTVNRDLKDLKKTYTDIQNYSEKCDEVLQQLQILVLKEGADSVALARCGDRVVGAE